MTSNPPSSLQSRQKLYHKRQNSTPIAFEAMKAQMHPNTTQRQQMHRRGQSCDMGRTPIRRAQGAVVSMHTNIGSIHGQQILREAQQQRTARPGQQYIQPRVDTLAAQQQCDSYQQQFQDSYNMGMSTMISPNGAMTSSQYQSMQMPLSAGSIDQFTFDENCQNYFQMAHTVQDPVQMMPEDRRASHPDLRIQTGLRPYTPSHPIQTADFPLTPAQTPLRHQSENILSPRPVSMQKSRSLQGIAEHSEVGVFGPRFDNQTRHASQVRATAGRSEPLKQSKPAHVRSQSTTSVAKETSNGLLFGEISHENDIPDLSVKTDLDEQCAPSSPGRPVLSPRKLSISDLNLDPEISASIEETNVSLDDIAQFIEGPDSVDNKYTCKFEDCNKRFGRKENIKSHVQTHLGDRQFKCNQCDKCFVRGHDLKRHVKIHTGKKAYACLCGNAFARHDALTRHRQRGMCIGAFEGVVRKEAKRGRPKKHRPEMEERLDKSARSRQNKPHSRAGSQADMYASSSSSCSMSSWGSPPTETMDHLSLQGDANSPSISYDDTMQLFGLNPQDVAMSSQSHARLDASAFPPSIFSFTPPASPGFSCGNRPTPSYRELTPADLASISEEPESQSQSRQPMDNVSAHAQFIAPHDPVYTSVVGFPNSSEVFDLPQGVSNKQEQSMSLPSLSHSSSPPPQEAGSAIAFDFPEDFNPLRMSTMSNISNLSFGLSAITKAMQTEPSQSTQDSQRNEFDSFLDYNDDSQLSLGMNMGMENNDSFFANL